MIWVAIGYFSLFDLGLGRALTQLVAQRLGSSEDAAHRLFWTTSLLIAIIGTAGALVVALLNPWLIHHFLRVPAALQQECVLAVYLLAFSIPFVLSTSAMRGMLEAHQQFLSINAIRLPMGLATYLGPLLVLPFSRSLVAVVALLVVTRLATWLAFLQVCFRTFAGLRAGVALDPTLIGPLFRFGGWMTVSNAVGPVIAYADRFLIGALITVSAVAYYATPYEVVTRLWIIPFALTGVLFPAFATTLAQDPRRTVLLFMRGVKYIFLAIFPISLVLVAFASDALRAWLGSTFAGRSTVVLQLLAAGILINCLSHVPFALVQGGGRADLTAKLNLAELIPYFVLVIWLIHVLGINGAAIAWVVRVVVEAAVYFVMAQAMLPAIRAHLWRLGLALVLAAGTLATATLLSGASRVLFVISALSLFALVAWFQVLSPHERLLGLKALTPGKV